MKETKPYENRIHVYHVTDGKLWTFTGINEACRYTDSIRMLGRIGPHFKIFCSVYRFVDMPYYRNVEYTYNDVIIRDDFGANVHINQLVDAWNARFKRKYYWTVSRTIPGSKPSGYRRYRSIRIINERRQAIDNIDAYDDYGIVIKPRGKRNTRNLPDSWDGYHRTQIRSWKKHKKHQWG